MHIMIAGATPALTYTRQYLLEAGLPVADSLQWDVKHLLLDVPSFRPGGFDPGTILASLPQDATIWGGNMNVPALDGFHCIDLLKDERYLTENADITADCTLTLLRQISANTWCSGNILVIGWGRIGKLLAEKLKNLGCRVTVAVRKASDNVRLQSLGYETIAIPHMAQEISSFNTIINTVPASVLGDEDLAGFSTSLKIDLASKRGIPGPDVIWARGLPGKYAPERSGRLIAETFLRILKEEFE